VQHTTIFAKWLAGLSGAAVVLACAYYMQAYLSVLSIKGDCVSRRFVADAIFSATTFLIWAIAAGLLALAAIVWPAAIRGGGTADVEWRRSRHCNPGMNLTDCLRARSAGDRSRRGSILVFLSGLSLATLIGFLIWFGVTIGGQAGRRAEGVARFRAEVSPEAS
jgi:hypothetical protein